VELALADALGLRMTSLLLRERPGWGGAGCPADVAGVVTWFGALQAQDVASVMWSLGVRLPGFTAVEVHAALERREALRTWPMRGTIHLVPPRDARWMLEVMGMRALAGAAARRASLGLSEQIADRAVDVLGAALAGGGRLTRTQCLQVLAEAGICVAGQAGYHLLWYASQRGVTCIAPNIGTEQTFVLLEEWVLGPHRPQRDEALARIALRYFHSHGPATRQDFAGWTGLTAADAKGGIAAAGADLVTVRAEGRDMHLDPALLDAHATVPVGAGRDDILVLPGFDEYLLGFKDRSLMLAAEHTQAIIPGGNGVFQATIVRGGRVVGTWKRSVTKGRTVVDLRPLVPLNASTRTRVGDAPHPVRTLHRAPPPGSLVLNPPVGQDGLRDKTAMRADAVRSGALRVGGRVGECRRWLLGCGASVRLARCRLGREDGVSRIREGMWPPRWTRCTGRSAGCCGWRRSPTRSRSWRRCR
jgi:Winged helix DNA-binding domain